MATKIKQVETTFMCIRQKISKIFGVEICLFGNVEMVCKIILKPKPYPVLYPFPTTLRKSILSVMLFAIVAGAIIAK